MLSNLSAIHILMAIVFCLSGLIINILQFVLYIALYNVNRRLYRKINYYLIYTSWSQVVALTEWWSGSSCTVYADDETFKQFGKEHCIVVMNHKYEVDWLMCWLVCDKLRMLANAKACAKSSLKYLPVIGWGWIFGEMIFFDRNWEKDSLTLGERLDKLTSYEDPIMLLFFCEGTRFTPEKHIASMNFAENNNLIKLKHHLLPRTKGFNFSVARFKKNANAVYDIQLGFPGDKKPTFFDVLRGEKFAGEMYVRRIPMDKIPTGSDEETSAWLYNLYQEKDEIMEKYLQTNTFPGKPHTMKRRIWPLLNGLFWLMAVGFPFCYLILQFLACGVLWVQIATVTGLLLLSMVVHLMIGVTKSDKGSSYGKTDTSPKRTNGCTSETLVDRNDVASSELRERNGLSAKMQDSDSTS